MDRNPDDLVRVVLEGTGRLSGTVEGSPMPRWMAEAGLDNVVDAFRTDIAAGDMRLSIVDEIDGRRDDIDGFES